jgi:SLOG cluster2
MSPIQRPLAGFVVNVSVSESDDSEERGFPTWQVNRVTVQLVAALFGQGASLVFGHDWCEDGVMEAIYGFARQVQAPIPLDPAEADRETQPLLQNLLPWPDSPFLTVKELERLSSTLRVSAAGLPPELLDFSHQNNVVDRESNAYRYLRARALTFLRHRLNQVSSARLCVGGRRTRAQGRYPGVIEEALFAVLENKPLYVSGLLGGAAEQVINALDGGAMPDEFCPPSNVNRLYVEPPVRENSSDTLDDRVLNRESVWNEFAQLGYEGLSRNNGLTVEENRQLHRTRVLDQVIELMLVGMSRVRAEGR